jgi:hypothetical protein
VIAFVRFRITTHKVWSGVGVVVCVVVPAVGETVEALALPARPIDAMAAAAMAARTDRIF